MTYIALLRGINVGGNKKVPMAELKALIEKLGFTDAKTLLNSGNAVFSGTGKPDAIAAKLEAAIEKKFGFDVSVVVRTAAELAEVVASNPIAAGEANGSRFLVAFCAKAPAKEIVDALAPQVKKPDAFGWREREIYLWSPNGILESNLFELFSDRKLKVATTARNWNTVVKLHALASPKS